MSTTRKQRNQAIIALGALAVILLIVIAFATRTDAKQPNTATARPAVTQTTPAADATPTALDVANRLTTAQVSAFCESYDQLVYIEGSEQGTSDAEDAFVNGYDNSAGTDSPVPSGQDVFEVLVMSC